MHTGGQVSSDLRGRFCRLRSLAVNGLDSSVLAVDGLSGLKFKAKPRCLLYVRNPHEDRRKFSHSILVIDYSFLGPSGDQAVTPVRLGICLASSWAQEISYGVV